VTLTEGRAWLAALPDELAAQRRVMTGLVDLCAGWPRARSLIVGCSLGRGAGAHHGQRGRRPPAPRRHPADLPAPMAAYVTRALAREPGTAATYPRRQDVTGRTT
jgi:hypothetical protein